MAQVFTRKAKKEKQTEFNIAPRAIKYKMMERALEGYLSTDFLPFKTLSFRREKLNYTMNLFSEIGTAKSGRIMLKNLHGCLHEMNSDYHSYFAIFDEVEITSESDFQMLTMAQLGQITGGRVQQVSDEQRDLHSPNDPDFTLTIEKQNVYIIGMHPHSTRENRRFPWPVLIFYSI